MAALLVLTTAPDLKAARRLARSLVKNKLAACVSLGKGWVSFYLWKGKLEDDSEVLLLIKTVKERFPRLVKFIRSHHTYQVPEIIGFNIDRSSSDYLSWIQKTVC